MPLNNDDRRWVAQEIQRKLDPKEPPVENVISAAIAGAVDALRPRGWRKAVHGLREIGPIATIAAVFVAVIVFAATQYSAANARLAQQARFEEKTSARLGKIETDIRSLLAVNTIRQAAELQPQELSKELPKLRESIQTVKDTGGRLSEQTLGLVQSRLLEVSDSSPGYWPLAFALISYRSIIITGMLSPPKPLSVFKDVQILGAQQSKVSGMAVTLGGLIEGLDFVDSWIEFDLGSPLTLKNTHFSHCVLVFRGLQVSSPSPVYQRITKQILASTVADVKIPSAG